MEASKTLDVAVFRNCRDNQPLQRHVAWPALARVLTDHEERTQKDGRLWSPTLYKPDATRAKQNVIHVSCLVLDFDKGDHPNAFAWSWDQWTYIIHSTFNHHEEAPRWRVVFPFSEPVPVEEWPSVWSQLAKKFGGNDVDPSCKDASRIYYLPACPPGAERIAHENEGEWLSWRDFLRPPVEFLIERAHDKLDEGRNNAGMWLACQMRDNGYSQAEAERADWHTYVPREKINARGKVDLYTEREWSETVRKVYASPARPGWAGLRNGATRNGAATAEEQTYVVNVVRSFESDDLQPPSELAEEALYGLAGDVVRAIEPHTESHPAGLLATFLIGAGCLMGRGPHVFRDGKPHAGNEFACLVGPTGGGGKGTASAQVERLLRACVVNILQKDDVLTMHDMHARESAYDNLLLSGLGSGEAMVQALADPDETDRRKLVFEEEFSKPLTVMRREGSTLSQNLRHAWDGSPLANRTKGKKSVAYGGHVSVLAHVTREELVRFLTATEVFNGFANRFLWFWTRRVRELPFGGGRPPLGPLATTFHNALEYSRELGSMEYDEEASELWDGGGIYSQLRNRTNDFFGALTSRAATHVTRIALIYAVLDGQNAIRIPHLMAALAVWDYNERTIRYVFGDSSGDDYADSILEWLLEVYPGGLTRTEIRDRFRRNALPGRIPKALMLLHESGQVERVMIEAEKGRPTEHWRAVQDAHVKRPNDINDKSPLNRAREWIKEREG